MNKKMQDIKADVKRLLVLFEAIIEVWPSNQNTMIMVMLQNMAHDASNCVNWNEEDDWNRMLAIKKAIEAMKTYYDYYLIGFIVEEIEMSFFAHEQMEMEGIAEENYECERKYDELGDLN